MFTFTTQYVYIFFKLKALFSKIMGLLLKAKYFYFYLNWRSEYFFHLCALSDEHQWLDSKMVQTKTNTMNIQRNIQKH